MRVVHVCADPGVPVFGHKGSSVHVREAVRALRALGHEVVMAVARTGGAPPEDLANVEVHLLPDAVDAPTSQGRERARREAGDRCGDVLDRCGPVDVVYERYSLWGSSAMAWARINGATGILEVNAPLPEEQAAFRTLHDRGAAEDVARLALGAAERVVAVSEPVAAWCRTMVDVDASRVIVVPNGVDTDRIRPRDVGAPDVTDLDRPLTVGFVGTLKPWHGVDVLADAFVALEPAARWRLLVIGDGPERDALARRLDSVTERVELTGAVDHALVPDLLGRMDIAVAPYPSTADYFSPLKLFEYLAAGIPTIASDVPAVRRSITEPDTVQLVPPDNAEALARAITRIGGDGALRRALGRRGRDHVVAHHTWAAAVDRILDGVVPARPTSHGRAALDEAVVR